MKYDLDLPFFYYSIGQQLESHIFILGDYCVEVPVSESSIFLVAELCGDMLKETDTILSCDCKLRHWLL